MLCDGDAGPPLSGHCTGAGLCWLVRRSFRVTCLTHVQQAGDARDVPPPEECHQLHPRSCPCRTDSLRFGSLGYKAAH